MKKQCRYCNALAYKDGEMCMSCEFEPPTKIFPKQTCPYCGYPFTPNKENQPTCGDPKCKGEYRRKQKGKVGRQKIKRICEICDKYFLPTRQNQKVCSTFKCQEERRRVQRYGPKKVRICAVCKKEYTSYGSISTCDDKACRKEFDKSSGRRAYQTRKRRLEESGGETKMPNVNFVEEQAGQCARCHKSIVDVTSQVHHIKPVAMGGDNSRKNLEALCKPCHKEVHRELRRKERESRENN